MLGPSVSFSVIIGSRNSGDLLMNCLLSVLNTNYQDFDVIVVDSGSTDGSTDKAKYRFAHSSRLRIVKLNKNYGYAGVNNIGSSISKKDILVFLDPDTEVDKDWLRELANIFKENHDVGAVQPMILDLNNPDRIQTGGMFMIKFCGWSWRWLANMSYEKIRKLLPRIVEIGIPGGAAFAVRRNLFQALGGFDESFFMYFEENDLAWRIWLSGFKVVLASKSKVYHMGGDVVKYSTGKYGLYRATKSFHYFKNCLRMVLKNYSLMNLLRFFMTTLICEIFLAIFGTFFERDVYALRSLFNAILWSLTNLKSTLYQRKQIQARIRARKDEQILPYLTRSLPLSSIVSRLMLNRLQLSGLPYRRLKA